MLVVKKVGMLHVPVVYEIGPLPCNSNSRSLYPLFTNNAESLFLQVEVESILYIHIA